MDEIKGKDFEMHDNDDDFVEQYQEDKDRFLINISKFNIDVLDENLYCYDSSVFSLSPAIQNRTSLSLFSKVNKFVDSAPAAKKSLDYIKRKTEYTPRLDLIPEEIKAALHNGTAEIIPCKDSAEVFYLQIRTTVKGLVINGKEYGKNRKIKDIPIGSKTIPADVSGAMQCLSMQNQLNQISSSLKEISEACEMNFGRIIQGQRDDRLAKLLSSRSAFIQALALSDENLQKHMLIQSIRDANSARAELAYQIKSDILLLGSDKSLKAKQMEKIVSDINTAIVAMNNAVQISLYSYQTLGEHNAQLAVIKEHETFIKQVLLKEIEYQGNKHLAWTVINSSGNGRVTSHDFRILPEKVLISCDSFIGRKVDNSINYLEENAND